MLESLVKIGSMLGAGLAIGLGAIGAGIGEGYAAGKAVIAIKDQPQVSGSILRTMLIGQAITETSSIFALVIALILVFQGTSGTLTDLMSYIGAGLAIGFGAIAPGIGAGLPAGSACEAVARNPKEQNNITITMLIGQAVTQTPVVFALVVAFILIFTRLTDNFVNSMSLLGAGLAMGVSTMGTGIGSGYAAEEAVFNTAKYPRNYSLTLRTMLLGQAVTQTPVVFALVVAFMLIFTKMTNSFAQSIAVLGAGLAMGFGAIGPGIGSGYTAGKAVFSVAKYPKNNDLILRTMLLGQSVAQSTSIYSLVIAFILIFLA